MAKSLRNMLKTSSTLEKQGIEFEMANTRLLIARAGGQNTRYNAAMTKLHDKHKRAIDLRVVNDEVVTNDVYEIYAEHVVLNWWTNTADDGKPDNWQVGIEGKDGELLDVNLENVVAYFKDVPDFFHEVRTAAENAQYFLQSKVETIAGN